jgi:hypothetical protein
MANTSLTSRYLKLVEKLERLGTEMTLVEKQLHTVTEAMTDEELEEIARKLPSSQHAMVRDLELHLLRRHRPPVE